MCKPDGDNMASSEKEVEREISRRKKTSKQRAANRKICQYSGMPEASQIKRPWNHQTKMSGIQKCQRQKTSKRSRSRWPCQPGGQRLFLLAFPCLYRFFSLSTSATRLAQALLVYVMHKFANPLVLECMLIHSTHVFWWQLRLWWLKIEMYKDTRRERSSRLRRNLVSAWSQREWHTRMPMLLTRL